jgi:hypothetical protein
VSTTANGLGYGWAWVALCLALAIHVVDEAFTGFLSVYNPAVKALRQRSRFLPLPTFTFKVWLGGLIAAVVLLFALSPFAFGVATWLAPFSVLLRGVYDRQWTATHRCLCLHEEIDAGHLFGPTAAHLRNLFVGAHPIAN